VPLLRYTASNTMNKNPLNKGILTENASGIGTVTPEMVETRARELAAIAGRVPPQPSEVDYEQAKRELTGGPDSDILDQVLESIPESERYEAQSAITRRSRLAKMRIARDGARVRSLLKKESKKRSTIRCYSQLGQLGRRTNANGDLYH
jgi:hypothetical protein